MPKSKFFLSGSDVYIYALNDDTSFDKLPPNVYSVERGEFGYYLKVVKKALEVPSKIYGKTIDRVNKCVHTYKTRKTSTGILLTGDKGTGKSLTMALLANTAIEQLNLPVVLVRQPYGGSGFINFLESIGECCLVFDEFGKMYTHRDRANEGEVSQATLLSLLDGVDKTKRLIIMTENSELDINEFLLSRPSRVYYHFRYRKLDEDSIRDYCEDVGVDVRTCQDIVNLSHSTRVFSFDMLQSLVEEHLRFGCSIDEAVADLNITIKKLGEKMIRIIKVVEKRTNKECPVIGPKMAREDYHGHFTIEVKNKPLTSTDDDDALYYADDVPSKKRDEEETDSIYFGQQHIAFEKDGKLVYERNGYSIFAETVGDVFMDYEALLV